MPKYAAGTCNTVYANIYAYPAPGGGACNIVLARLYLGTNTIGWTKVDEYAWEVGEPIKSTATLGVRYDSTHFPYDPAPNASNELGVRVQYLDNLGRYFYEEKVHPVKNKALLGNFPFPAGLLGLPVAGSQSHDEVESAVGTSYSVVKKTGANFTGAQWFPEIIDANFIWVTSHGSSGSYWVSSGTDNAVDGPDTVPNAHAYWIATQYASNPPITPDAYPPYNLSESPPCNFMFVSACETLAADFSDVLYPHFNSYMGLGGLGLRDNQAVAGFTICIQIGDMEKIANALCGLLFSQWTAYSALMQSIPLWNAAGAAPANEDRPFTPSDVEFNGDPYTRVKGVYTGTTSQAPNGWYISL